MEENTVITPEEFDRLHLKNRRRINFIECAIELYGLISFKDAEELFRKLYNQRLFTENFSKEIIMALDSFYKNTPKNLEPFIFYDEDSGKVLSAYLDNNSERMLLWTVDFEKEFFVSQTLDDYDELLEIQSKYPIYVPDKSNIHLFKGNDKRVSRFLNDASNRFVSYLVFTYSMSKRTALEIVKGAIIDSISCHYVYKREDLLESIEYRMYAEASIGESKINKVKELHEEAFEDFYSNLRMWQFCGHTYNEIRDIKAKNILLDMIDTNNK